MPDPTQPDDSNQASRKAEASSRGEEGSKQLLKPRELFDKALDLASVKEREQFLDEACGGNDALKLQVERLLDAHFMAEG
jgi:hypothetical protein